MGERSLRWGWGCLTALPHPIDRLRWQDTGPRDFKIEGGTAWVTNEGGNHTAAKLAHGFKATLPGITAALKSGCEGDKPIGCI